MSSGASVINAGRYPILHPSFTAATVNESCERLQPRRPLPTWTKTASRNSPKFIAATRASFCER